MSLRLGIPRCVIFESSVEGGIPSLAAAQMTRQLCPSASTSLFINVQLLFGLRIFSLYPLADIRRAILKSDSALFAARQKPDCIAICQSHIAQVQNDACVSGSRTEEPL